MTTVNSFKKLSVADRNAVLNGLNIDDAVAAKSLGITVEEVTTGRSEVAATDEFDTTPFQAHFQKPTSPATGGSSTTIARPPAKKRGPQGTRIVLAFSAVTDTPVPLAAFAIKHHVSENCLKQPKRFFKGEGRICVRKHSDHNGEVCIWHEAAEETAVA